MIFYNGRTKTVLVAFGRRFSAKTVEYQLLDKALNVIENYTGDGVKDLSNGRYGFDLTLTNNLIAFIRIKEVEDSFIAVEPCTLANPRSEMSFIANFGKRRTGKTVQYRLLDIDLNELTTWSATGVVELGGGYYGIAPVINSVTMKFIEYKNVTDTLFLSDPINYGDADGYEYSATAYDIKINKGVDVEVNNIPLITVLKTPNLSMEINIPDFKVQRDIGVTL